MHLNYLGLVIWIGLTACAAATEVERPAVLDDRLTLEVIAAEPDIVTPTGIAVDEQGRVLVVECHTHFPPENYAGPSTDRIRRFSDPDHDGTFDHVETVLEGTTHTMNLAIDHRQHIYVATRSEIFRLDEPGGGKPAAKTTLVRLQTKGDYPHNGLSGFAFDLAGRMYFGMGENLGVPFELIGSDGRTLTGSEGGHIFRCRLDGAQLERYATGFWNPFHVAFDAFGRLFAVDNDPDSLPPCRLMHIVEGGDYGYKFRNGRKGLHPFTAWNGELPGTLPMVAGTGEAPSGVVAYESGQFPSDYLGMLLVTSWGDHRIEGYKLQPRGASLQAQMQPIVRGGENFRPVGIALAPDGSIFFSDWVDKSYPVHGKGRIWRLRSKAGVKIATPTHDDLGKLASVHGPHREQAAVRLADSPDGRHQLFEIAAKHDDARTRATALWALSQTDVPANADLVATQPSDDLAALAVDVLPTSELKPLAISDRRSAVKAAALRHLADAGEDVWPLTEDIDPFIQQAARLALARMNDSPQALLQGAKTKGERLAALLILRARNNEASRQLLPELAADEDPSIRFAAVQWIGEERLAQHRKLLDVAIHGKATSPRLFSGYLAAIERLERPQRKADDEWSVEQYAVAALLSDQSSSDIRRFALRTVPADHPELTLPRFMQWISAPDTAIQLEAVRSLRDSRLVGREKLLGDLAQDTNRDEQLRAEAIIGLSPPAEGAQTLLQKLASDSSPALRREALRSLRSTKLSPDELEALQRSQSGDDYGQSLVEQLKKPGGSNPPMAGESRPDRNNLDAWLAILDKQPGDARAGERIFFHPQGPGCYRCHTVDGRGGNVGPDLSRISSGADRRKLLESILRPSQEVAPQFTTWTIRTVAGKVITGILLHDDAQGIQSYGTSDGQAIKVVVADVEERVASRQSIMPENLIDQITAGELADLLALLGELAKR